MLINFLLGVGVVLVLFMSTYGWGGLILRLLYRGQRQPASFNAAVGAATFLFFGGILNVTHTVSPVAIDLMIFGGLGLALLELVSLIRRGEYIWFRVDKPGLWVMGIVTGYLIYTLFPMIGFNYHDDFHAYLIFPFRMLQLGTVVSGSDTLLGHGSLNAQSFLHAILLRYFSVEYINTFDVIYSFFLSGLLLNEIGKKAGLHWAYRIITVITFIVINPQLVNISSIYSGSLMILGLVYGSMLAVESGPGSLRETILRLLPVALFASAIAALKITFLIYLVFYLFLLVVLLPFLGWKMRQTLYTGISLGALILIIASPWLFIMMNSYIGILTPASKAMVWQVTENIDGAYTQILKVRTPSGLFSTSRLFWGGSYIGYLLMWMVMFGSSIFLGLKMVRSDVGDRDPESIVAIAAFLGVCISAFLLAFQVRPDLTVRYSCPLLIAVFPLTISLLAPSLSLSLSSGREFRVSALGGALIVAQVLVIGQFADVFANNLAKAKENRSMLSFPIRTQSYFDFVISSFTKASRNEVRRAQVIVPEGEPLFAWLATPFHLDFARNEIIAINTPGIAELAKAIDLSSGPRVFETYLRARNIRYIVWSRNSYGMRNRQTLRRELEGTIRNESARENLDLMNTIEWLMNSRTILYNERGTVVIDIGKG